MYKVKATTSLAIVLMIGISIISLFLPTPISQGTGASFHQQLVVTLLIGFTHFTAALLFVLSLSNFKVELRKADIMICIGMVALGISQFMYPIFTYLAITNPAAYLIPSVLAITADVLILNGVKRFARLLTIKPRLFSWPIIIGATVLCMAMSTILPHHPTPIPDGPFKFSQSLYIVSIVLLLFTTSIMILIRRATSNAYKTATGWFIAAQLVAMASLVFLFTSNMINPALLSWLQVPIVTPLAVVGLFSMAAGYAFNTVGVYGESVSQLHHEVTILDVIVYSASLASSPRDIDSILDTVRLVTSRQTSDKKLTIADEKKLVKVYHELENYLINHEPLREFEAVTIRKSVARQFNLGMTDPLWSKLLTLDLE